MILNKKLNLNPRGFFTLCQEIFLNLLKIFSFEGCYGCFATLGLMGGAYVLHAFLQALKEVFKVIIIRLEQLNVLLSQQIK